MTLASLQIAQQQLFWPQPISSFSGQTWKQRSPIVFLCAWRAPTESWLTLGHLTISNQPLQLIANNTIKSLGLIIQVLKDQVSANAELKSLLQSMLTAVDEALPTHQETETQTLQLRNLSQVELASQHQWVPFDLRERERERGWEGEREREGGRERETWRPLLQVTSRNGLIWQDLQTTISSTFQEQKVAISQQFPLFTRISNLQAMPTSHLK